MWGLSGAGERGGQIKIVRGRFVDSHFPQRTQEVGHPRILSAMAMLHQLTETTLKQRLS